MKKIIYAFILLSLVSCKVTKQTKTDYEYSGETYNKTEYVHDTTYINRIEYQTIWDTAYMELDAETDIYFTEGGGTYNATTGEMSGVVSVRTSEHEKALQKRLESLTQKEDSMSSAISALQDSLSNVAASGHTEDSVVKETKSLWWMWLLIGFVIGAGGIIALKKIPVTKPFMSWL